MPAPGWVLSAYRGELDAGAGGVAGVTFVVVQGHWLPLSIVGLWWRGPS